MDEIICISNGLISDKINHFQVYSVNKNKILTSFSWHWTSKCKNKIYCCLIIK